MLNWNHPGYISYTQKRREYISRFARPVPERKQRRKWWKWRERSVAIVVLLLSTHIATDEDMFWATWESCNEIAGLHGGNDSSGFEKTGNSDASYLGVMRACMMTHGYTPEQVDYIIQAVE